MTRHIARRGRAAAVGISLSVILGVAQAGNASGQVGPEDVGGQVTVSGCLIEFSSPPSGAGATDALSSPDASSESQTSRTAGEQFVLANVETATRAASASRRYVVMELQTDELRKYVMHQVEVSGTLVLRRPSSRALNDLPRLHASSIRMIAGACTTPRSPE